MRRNSKLHPEWGHDQDRDADPHRLCVHIDAGGARCARKGRLLGGLEAAHGGGG